MLKKFPLTMMILMFLVAAPIIAEAYTVQSGDTLSEIAKKHDLSMNELLEQNPDIDHPDLIHEGDTIDLDLSTSKQNQSYPHSIHRTQKVGQPEQTSLDISESELDLLARIIHAEAKGEVYEGKVAVAHVVLNRVQHPQFPDSIRDVIYEPGQFEPVMNGSIHEEADDESFKAAKEAVHNLGDNNESIYFYNPETSTSSWIFTTQTVKEIGNHTFAK